MFAAMAFVKDHARAPTKEEKAAFAWRALLACWAVSILSMILIALVTGAGVGNLFRSFNFAFVLVGLGIIAFVSLLYYVAIRGSFGWFAKVLVRQRAASG